MNDKFPNGVYPVMLTPFTADDKVDFASLGRIIDWYIANGAAGLFAVCQSSEMFFLSLEERVAIAGFVTEYTAGRVPVLASGHISDTIDSQAGELNAIAQTGADAVILLTNRLAKEDESDRVWLDNLQKLLARLPADVPLGFYECPYPYKRVISPELLAWCADTGRFYFIKDTSCCIDNIAAKLAAIKGSTLKLFNANTSTLLESLSLGAGGFSGVMANFHADLYVWLINNFAKEPEKARKVADFLTVASLIERQVYPVNAKYYQQSLGNFSSVHTRVKDAELLDHTAMLEIDQLTRMVDLARKLFTPQENIMKNV